LQAGTNLVSGRTYYVFCRANQGKLLQYLPFYFMVFSKYLLPGIELNEIAIFLIQSLNCASSSVQNWIELWRFFHRRNSL
jgi:hypothetical protein